MSALTPWNARLAQWLHDPAVLASVGIGLTILGVVSLITLPFLLIRIPADHFTRAHATEPRRPTQWLGWFIKNLFGVLLLLVGIVMLVLPGQGILTIFAALVLLDFPGKRRLERWLVQRPRVLSGLNALRARARRPPLEWED
jgi:hypothetical protein